MWFRGRFCIVTGVGYVELSRLLVPGSLQPHGKLHLNRSVVTVNQTLSSWLCDELLLYSAPRASWTCSARSTGEVKELVSRLGTDCARKQPPCSSFTLWGNVCMT